jgi:Fic family protein
METLSSLLAEIDSLKRLLDALRPLDSESVRHAIEIEYTYESNRIEGNTLTLWETEMVIAKGLTIGGKSMREHLEAVNHHEALLFLRDLVRDRTLLISMENLPGIRGKQR